jgi:glycosyltransferase involved in cell wall biosynthesis
VVVHEAASAGLVILASDRVGATPHLVQYNYNGFVFDPTNSSSLAKLMQRISDTAPVKLEAMAAASHNLSFQFTPAQWANSLTSFVELKSAQRI